MNAKILAGVLLVGGIIAVGLFLYPIATGFGPSGSISTSFYDEDGKEIFMPAFMAGATIVSSFAGTVGWTITSSGSMDTSTIDTTITFYYEIRRNTYTAGILWTSPTVTWSSTDAATGSKTSDRYTFATILASYMDYKDEGWIFYLYGDVIAAANVDGERIVDGWEGIDSFTILYEAGQLYVSGSVVHV